MSDAPASRTAVRAVLAALGMLALLVVGGGPEVLCLDGRSWEPLLLEGLGTELLVGLTGTGVVALTLPRLLPADPSVPDRRPSRPGPATAAPLHGGRTLVLVRGGDRGPPPVPPSGS